MGTVISVWSRCAFMCLALVGALSVAAVAPASADYDDRLKAARDYVESSGMERGIERQISTMLSRVTDQLKREYPGVDASKIENISNTVMREFSSRIPELLDDAARVYAQHFTTGELKEMTRYNRSAVGRKQQEKQMVVAREMGDALDLWLTRVSYNATRRMQELLAEQTQGSSSSGGYNY